MLSVYGKNELDSVFLSGRIDDAGGPDERHPPLGDRALLIQHLRPKSYTFNALLYMLWLYKLEYFTVANIFIIGTYKHKVSL